MNRLRELFGKTVVPYIGVSDDVFFIIPTIVVGTDYGKLFIEATFLGLVLGVYCE